MDDARGARIEAKMANPHNVGLGCMNPNCVALRRLVDAMVKRPEMKDEAVTELTEAVKEAEEKLNRIRQIEMKLASLQPYALDTSKPGLQ